MLQKLEFLQVSNFFLLDIYQYCCKVLKSAISAKLQKIIKMTDLAPLNFKLSNCINKNASAKSKAQI